MAYVKEDGTIVERTPFSLFGWLWGIVDFFYLFVGSLVNPNMSRRSGSDGGSGRRIGGFGPTQSGPPPPPAGGCGCG